jgi:hypothetical protein
MNICSCAWNACIHICLAYKASAFFSFLSASSYHLSNPSLRNWSFATFRLGMHQCISAQYMCTGVFFDISRFVCADRFWDGLDEQRVASQFREKPCLVCFWRDSTASILLPISWSRVQAVLADPQHRQKIRPRTPWLCFLVAMRGSKTIWLGSPVAEELCKKDGFGQQQRNRRVCAPLEEARRGKGHGRKGSHRLPKKLSSQQ